MAEPKNYIKDYTAKQDATKLDIAKYRQIREPERDLQGTLIDEGGKPDTDTRTAAERNQDYLNNPLNKERLMQSLQGLGDIASPFAMAGMGALAGTALVTAPTALVGSVFGGEATNLATDYLSKGKYNTWGQMVSDKTGLSRTLSEFTNPGAIIGGAAPSAYQYGSGYIAGSRQPVANNFRLAGQDWTPQNQEIFDKLSNIRKLYAEFSTNSSEKKIANLINGSNLTDDEVATLFNKAVAEHANPEYMGQRINEINKFDLNPKGQGKSKINIFEDIPEEPIIPRSWQDIQDLHNRGSNELLPDPVKITLKERGYGDAYFKRQIKADEVNKKYYDENVVPTIERDIEYGTWGDPQEEDLNPLIGSLFRTQDSNPQAAIDNAIFQLKNINPRGKYVSSGSLSTDSYAATAASTSKVAGTPGFQVGIGRETGLNGYDDFSKLGISPKHSTIYLDKYLSRVNVDGKKFPAPRFSPGYDSPIVPEIIINKTIDPPTPSEIFPIKQYDTRSTSSSSNPSSHPWISGGTDNTTYRNRVNNTPSEHNYQNFNRGEIHLNLDNLVQRNSTHRTIELEPQLQDMSPLNQYRSVQSEFNHHIEAVNRLPQEQRQDYFDRILNPIRQNSHIENSPVRSMHIDNIINQIRLGIQDPSRSINAIPEHLLPEYNLPPTPTETNVVWKSGGKIDYINNFKFKNKWQKK